MTTSKLSRGDRVTVNHPRPYYNTVEFDGSPILDEDGKPVPADVLISEYHLSTIFVVMAGPHNGNYLIAVPTPETGTDPDHMIGVDDYWIAAKCLTKTPGIAETTPQKIAAPGSAEGQPAAKASVAMVSVGWYDKITVDDLAELYENEQPIDDILSTLVRHSAATLAGLVDYRTAYDEGVRDHIADMADRAGLKVMGLDGILGIILDRREDAIAYLEGVTEEDILEMYTTIIAPAIDDLEETILP